MREIEGKLMEKAVNRLIIVTFAAALLFGALAYHYRNAEHDSICREDLSFSLSKYIDIDLNTLDVTIMPYDGELIRVSYASDLPLAFKMEDNKLIVTESSRFIISLFTGGDSAYGLKMLLPREVYKEIKVHTGTGHVNVGRVDSNVVSVITNSGDIVCENAVSRSSLTSSSGNITLDFDETVNGSSIFTRSGNAEISFPKSSSVLVNFETETGMCSTDLPVGAMAGSSQYSFNGGNRVINAALQSGVLKIYEKGKNGNEAL